MNDPARLDERSVSWKILLPVGPESRILAMGFGDGGLAGLTRSSGKVDTEPAECLQYDVIIIGDKIDHGSYDLCDLICRVKSDGIVVNTTGKHIDKQLNHAGFRNFRHYAALPAGKPRLFIPLASRKSRARGLAFHSPGSFKARISLAVAQAVNCLGMRFHLMKHTISLYARSQKAFENNGLLQRISEHLGYPIIDLVIFGGSESPRRKITALAVTGGQGKDVVVKIADTELGAEAIKQESQALQMIAASELSGQAPKLIAEGQWCGYYVQLQEKAIGNSRRQIDRLTESHLEFLSKLAMIERKVLPLKETRIWQNVKALAGATSSKAMPQSIRIALEKALSDEFANMPVVCHRTHGDFAPWNIKVHNGKLFVYDWEDSLSDGLALTDIFHFLYRQASLVGSWPGARNLILLITDSARSLISFVGLGELSSKQPIKAVLTVWIVQAYLSEPCEQLAELASALGAQLE